MSTSDKKEADKFIEKLKRFKYDFEKKMADLNWEILNSYSYGDDKEDITNMDSKNKIIVLEEANNELSNDINDIRNSFNELKHEYDIYLKIIFEKIIEGDNNE